MRTIKRDPRRRLQEAGRILGAVARGKPYVMYRRHYERKIAELLALEAQETRPDVLYLDHLDSFMYANAARSALRVCDLHNVYSLLAARAAADDGGALRRAYLEREARLLAGIERQIAREMDLLFAVSEEEARYFAHAGARRVVVVPNGVDCGYYADIPAGRQGGPPTIMYVGAMSWQPNASAAKFLALDVLPTVRRRFPTARVRIVGRDPLPEVLALAQQPGVEVTGRVEDILPELHAAHVLAVPLDSGGGTRLKILEAFAAGLPVVSTPVGCEGLVAEPGTHILVAERPQFAAALIGLLLDQDRARSMAEAARLLARRVYDWQVIGRTAVEAIEQARRDRRVEGALG